MCYILRINISFQVSVDTIAWLAVGNSAYIPIRYAHLHGLLVALLCLHLFACLFSSLSVSITYA